MIYRENGRKKPSRYIGTHDLHLDWIYVWCVIGENWQYKSGSDLLMLMLHFMCIITLEK